MLTPDVIDGAFDITGSIVLITLFGEHGVLISGCVLNLIWRWFIFGVPVKSHTIVSMVSSICAEC